MSDVANTVVVRLDASLSRVRQNALLALGKLGPAAIAQYADAIVTKLEEIAELALDRPARAAVRGMSCACLSRGCSHVVPTASLRGSRTPIAVCAVRHSRH